MKRSNFMQTKLTQFTYDHKKFNGRLIKIKKSADELGRLLNNMTPKLKEKEEGKEEK